MLPGSVLGIKRRAGLMIYAPHKLPEDARIRLDAELACLVQHLNQDQGAANVPLSILVR